MRYRKKPVIVKAFKYDGCFMSCKNIPQWAKNAFEKGDMYLTHGVELYIKTLDGDHHVSVGDYIIKGVKGELYPCKPDIFEQTYERTEEQ